MKRSISDSEDDLFDDSLNSTSPSQSCHITDRKKRRGIIEKRRRDRINSSLSELRRLVPTAFEKQGSAKLEKAEILQMTVDHLKILHQKGITGYNYPDPHSLAMDYRSVGFRECAAEVARYLVTMEGMDIQDPLRLRLMSHLQCFSAQREAAAKSSFQNTSVWSGTVPHHNQINSGYNMNTLNTHNNVSSLPMLPSATNQTDHVTHPGSGLSGLQLCPSSQNNSDINHGSSGMSCVPSHINSRVPTTGNVAPHFSSTPVTTSMCPPLQQVGLPGQFSMTSFPMLSPTAPHNYSPSHSSSMPTAVKPYRPWGSEMTY